MALLHRREPEDALMQFEYALRVSPDHTLALLGAAEAHLLLGHPEMAWDLGHQVLGREPSNADALFLAAQAAEALHHPKQAITLLQKAAELHPANVQFQIALERLRQDVR